MPRAVATWPRSTRSTSAITSRCSPSRATCSGGCTTPRTSSSTRSSPPTARSAPARSRGPSAPGSTPSPATAASPSCARGATRLALGGDECVSTDGLAAEVEQREELRALVADLRRLPDDQRAALLLAELGELTHVEVARVIGVRQGKVKALVFQARETLAAASHARSLPCRSIREELSVATGAGLRRRHLRDHLTQCEGCREFSEQVRAQRAALAIVLPVVPSVGLHEAIVGGAAAAGAGAAGAGAAGAGALSAGSVAAKLLTIAAVGGAAAGGGALGLTELNPGGGDRPAVARAAPPAPRSADPGAEFTAVVQRPRAGAQARSGTAGVVTTRRRRPTAAAPRRRTGARRRSPARRSGAPRRPPATPGTPAARPRRGRRRRRRARRRSRRARRRRARRRRHRARRRRRTSRPRPARRRARPGRPTSRRPPCRRDRRSRRPRPPCRRRAGGAAVTRRLGARAGEEAGRGDAGGSAARRRARAADPSQAQGLARGHTK